jgi:hypothetical protein
MEDENKHMTLLSDKIAISKFFLGAMMGEGSFHAVCKASFTLSVSK